MSILTKIIGNISSCICFYCSFKSLFASCYVYTSSSFSWSDYEGGSEACFIRFTPL